MRVRQLDRFPFLPRAHIEKVNFFATRDPIRKLPWLDLHRCICFWAGGDVADYLVDVEVLVASADTGERLIVTESTTTAAADVILAKKRALCAGKLQQQIPHGDIRVDGD